MRSIARLNYMALDRPDLAVAARTLSQNMAAPRTGTAAGIKRAIRYSKKIPRGVRRVPGYDDGDGIRIWTGSDWAGDRTTRRSCSGGSLQIGDTTIHHWPKIQSNIA